LPSNGQNEIDPGQTSEIKGLTIKPSLIDISNNLIKNQLSNKKILLYKWNSFSRQVKIGFS